MSNKSSQFKNRNNKSTQVGNFLVSFEKGQLQSVKITSVSGNWNIRYRQDNPLFLWITDQMKSEEGRKILHLVFATYYAACNGVPDNIFFEDILKAYQNSIDRINEANLKSSDEENNQIINEERQKYNNLKSTDNDIRN